LFNGLGGIADDLAGDPFRHGRRAASVSSRQAVQDGAQTAEVPRCALGCAAEALAMPIPDFPAHFIASVFGGGCRQLGFFPDTPYEGRGTLPHCLCQGMAAAGAGSWAMRDDRPPIRPIGGGA